MCHNFYDNCTNSCLISSSTYTYIYMCVCAGKSLCEIYRLTTSPTSYAQGPPAVGAIQWRSSSHPNIPCWSQGWTIHYDDLNEGFTVCKPFDINIFNGVIFTSSTVLGTYKSPILTQCLKDKENCLFIIIFVPMYVYVHFWINIQYHLSTDFPGDHGLKSSGPCLGTLPAGAWVLQSWCWGYNWSHISRSIHDTRLVILLRQWYDILGRGDDNNILECGGFMFALKETLRLSPGSLMFAGVPCSRYLGCI